MVTPLPELFVIVILALASYFCRIAGFALMNYVPFTPAVRRGLEALPGSVVAAIIIPGAIAAGIPGIAGVAAGIIGMIVFKRDIAAMVLGCAAAALCRAYGFA